MVVIMIVIIIVIIHMITCHGNRSTEGGETGGNVGEVGKSFEGKGGEDKRQAPYEDI